jgi:hypothetical protein
MRTLFRPMAAVVTVVAQQSQAVAVANARLAAIEASARRLQRDEVAQFLQALATRGSAPAIVVAR